MRLAGGGSGAAWRLNSRQDKGETMKRCTPFKYRPILGLMITVGLVQALPSLADNTPQKLPFSQDWSNTGLITASDDWSGVPGIVGYRGDGLTGATGTDPQTIVADGTSTPVDVNANQTNPSTYTTGGLTEFHLSDPAVALTGSGTADAPFLLINLDTTGFSTIQVSYKLRDLDASTDNAVQQFALQYRIGNSGNFVNLPAGYVADASSGPSAATLVTPVSVVLPAAADNRSLVQLRIITTNAAGNDEMIGVDDIAVTGKPDGTVIDQPMVLSCPALALSAGESGSVTLTATDPDSIVNAAAISGGSASGISLGSFSAASADGGTASVPLNVDGSVAAGNYNVLVTFANDDADSNTCNVSVQVADITPIPAIQGSGDASPLAGQTVTTQGVVTKVIPDYGWFMQAETGDGDAATSDGIFVYNATSGVAVGQRLRLKAAVSEYYGLTELSGVTDMVVLAEGISMTPVTVAFPEAVEGDLERYEGMLIHIDGDLTVSQNYFQGRYGEVTLSSGGRLEKPTNIHRANSAEALALADANARRRITIDDGSNLQNPNPIPYIGEDNTLRAGDTVHGLTGVLYYGAVSDSLRDYKLHPTVTPAISRDNPRSATPADVGGNVRVASFNVLNYFTTIDQSGARCYPGMSRSDCRGADSALEFSRQRAKIIAAIQAIDADVVGLMEIENNGNTAVNDLVAGLNAAMGAGTYAAVGLPTGGTGTDAIRVAMIYKPARLSAEGNAVSDTDAIHNRPPLAQTFAMGNGEKFSVVVNHFKSKSSCPSDGSDANADQGDAQGCWNALRLQQARRLRSFVAGLQASSGDGDVLLIGDFNAYGKEDPIVDLTDNGFVDQVARYNDFGYSYVFDGEAGYLDHALATASLSAQISGTVEWHINTDEPSVIDYNTEYKTQDLYAATPYRSSDHDPVVVGLELLHAVTGTSGRDTLLGTSGDDAITGGLGADTLSGATGKDRFVYTSVLDGIDTITDFQVGEDRIVLRQLLQSLGISSVDPLGAGYVTCTNSGSSALVGIDADGSAGSARSRALVLVKNLGCASLAVPGNFSF